MRQITETGTRGFLQWARQEYPAPIYQQIAAQVVRRVPGAFQGYMYGGWKRTAALRGFADATGTATTDTADAASNAPMQASWGDQISEIIGTITGSALSYQQQQQQSNIINTQLQLAQQGKNPAAISLSSNGITFGSNMSAGTVVAIVVGGFLVGKLLKIF